VPIYTRHVSSEDYGILGLVVAMTTFLTMVLAFGGRAIIMRFYYQSDDENHRREFMGTFWLFLVLVPGLLTLSLLLFGRPLSQLLWSQLPFDPFVRTILVSAYLEVAFFVPLLSLYRAREQATWYAGLCFLKAAVTTGFICWYVVIAGGGAVGVVQGQLVGALAAAIVSGILLWREIRISWRWRLLKPALAFGMPLLLHFIAHWALNLSDRSILDRHVGLGMIGIYSLGYQFGNAVQVLITSANHALMPAFSRASRSYSETKALSPLITYYLLGVAILGVLLALMGPDVIALVTPVAYHDAGKLAPWFAVGAVAVGYYYVPMNLLAMTVGDTKVVPLLTLIAGAINISLNLLLIPRFGILAAAINRAVAYLILASLMALRARRVRTLTLEQSRVAKALAAVLLVYLFGTISMRFPPLVNLAVGILAVCCLPISLWLLGFWTHRELRRMGQLCSQLSRALVRL
jgi:O-antigen/teichoic acid export membrane protein